MKINKVVSFTLSIILFVVPVLIIPTNVGPYNILKIIVLLACGFVLLITTLMQIKKIKFDTQDIIVTIFGGLAILSTIFSTNIR